jgi:hypothetical protein
MGGLFKVGFASLNLMFFIYISVKCPANLMNTMRKGRKKKKKFFMRLR